MFDTNGNLKTFKNVEEIFREFFNARKQIYEKRIDYFRQKNRAKLERLEERVRLIQVLSSRTHELPSQKDLQLVTALMNKGFKLDPIHVLERKMQQKHSIEEEESLFDHQATSSNVLEDVSFKILVIFNIQN